MRTLADRGAEAILFGCTEIELGASSRRGPQDRAYAESGPRLGAVLLSFVRGSSERRAEAHLWSHKQHRAVQRRDEREGVSESLIKEPTVSSTESIG
jgi:hypothetical protein